MRSYKWCWPEGFQFSYSETEWKRKGKRGEDIKTTSSGNFLASMERDVWLQSRRGIKWVEASGRQRGFLLMGEIRSHLYGFKDILCRRLKKKQNYHLKYFSNFTEHYTSMGIPSWISQSGILQLKKQQVQMGMHYKTSSSAEMTFPLSWTAV